MSTLGILLLILVGGLVVLMGLPALDEPQDWDFDEERIGEICDRLEKESRHGR